MGIVTLVLKILCTESFAEASNAVVVLLYIRAPRYALSVPPLFPQKNPLSVMDCTVMFVADNTTTSAPLFSL